LFLWRPKSCNKKRVKPDEKARQEDFPADVRLRPPNG
jgi:hypothetical protein